MSWGLAAWVWLVGCGAAPSVDPVVEPALAPEPVAAPAPPAPAGGGVRVVHSRVDRSPSVPQHVSATWVAEGLQVMVTGFDAPCAPPPSFMLVAAEGAVKLLAEPVADAARCEGRHTVMMQIDGLSARDLTVDVVRADGSLFGSTALRATDH